MGSFSSILPRSNRDAARESLPRTGVPREEDRERPKQKEDELAVPSASSPIPIRSEAAQELRHQYFCEYRTAMQHPHFFGNRQHNFTLNARVHSRYEGVDEYGLQARWQGFRGPGPLIPRTLNSQPFLKPEEVDDQVLEWLDEDNDEIRRHGGLIVKPKEKTKDKIETDSSLHGDSQKASGEQEEEMKDKKEMADGERQSISPTLPANDSKRLTKHDSLLEDNAVKPKD